MAPGRGKKSLYSVPHQSSLIKIPRNSKLNIMFSSLRNYAATDVDAL